MNIGEVMSLVFQLAELSKMAPRSELVNHYFRWLQAGCAMMVKAPTTGVVSTLRYGISIFLFLNLIFVDLWCVYVCCSEQPKASIPRRHLVQVLLETSASSSNRYDFIHLFNLFAQLSFPILF